jgi:hypothetical protein
MLRKSPYPHPKISPQNRSKARARRLRFFAFTHRIRRNFVAEPRSEFFRTSSQRCSRRDGRVAEGARLESVFTRKGNVGSNPTLSAKLFIIKELRRLHIPTLGACFPFGMSGMRLRRFRCDPLRPEQRLGISFSLGGLNFAGPSRYVRFGAKRHAGRNAIAAQACSFAPQS